MRVRQTRLKEFLSKYPVRTSRRVRIGTYVAFGLVLYFVLLGTVLPERFNFAVGQVSQALITAPIDAVDTRATEAARQAAAANVSARYDLNPTVYETALSQLDKLVNAIESAKTARVPNEQVRLQQARDAVPAVFSTSLLQSLLNMNQGQFVVVSSDAIRIAQRMLQTEFSTSDQKQAGMMIDQQLVTLDVDKPTRLIIGQIVSAVLHPNLIYDPVLTQQARLQAERSVPDVWINRGDLIVRRGQLITPGIMSQLRDLKLLKTEADYGIYAGFFFFIGLLVLATATFIQLRKSRLSQNNVDLLLYTGLIILLAILIRIARAGVDAGLPSSISFAIPISMGSMLIAMFFGMSLATLSSVLLAVLTSAAFSFAFQPFFVALMGALGATMAMTRVQNRRVFMRAGFLTAGLNVVSIAILHFVFTSSSADWAGFGIQLVYGLVGGVLSAVFTLGLLPYLETTFGVITHVGLLELANPNHPLLRKLLLEAPGTYHHSLIVGNLAESAAEAIGADPLICRVGSLFHDVGKMKRPLFFIENQIGGENPHDKVAPNLSYLIVSSHVTDGLEMLREHNLPEPIRAICAEHHGTTVMWYFYNKAVEEDKHNTPDIDQFRYPGPKPTSKEAAIVMMCDAVEASVRSIAKPTPQRIEALIRKIIKDRLQDGQLDACDVTLRDLDRMVDAFLRTLQGIYHERIEYPDPERILAAKAK